MSTYDHKKIAEYWSKKWDEEGIYRTDIHSDKKKLYLLVEFPYPSGAGLHMGHMRSYTAMDVIARKKRREGFEVLFPIGWDAFGLPAENYAIKTGIHPRITTEQNINTFRRQLKEAGFSFDWSREVDTTDPKYYKWTQWIFLKLYEKGLAYKKEMPVNWCPKDKCVLANEEVVDGACERCGTPVEKKNKKQWMLAITKYAERLAKDLDETAYLDKIKIQQRNWVGLSTGSEISFRLKANGVDTAFPIFTTRADTVFGCTYCVLAPEHPLVQELIEKHAITNAEEVTLYSKQAREKLDIDRSAEGKQKTGVRLEGAVAINPATQEEIPVFIADYVLPQYGTGAIMAVPAHDERDYEFALQYGLPVKEVVRPYVIDHVNVPRADKPTKIRRNVHAIVFDQSAKKYLIIRNAIHKWDTIVIGGVEDGEDLIEAAKRELLEETGYTDVVFKRILGDPVQAGYFAPHKDENRLAIASALYFELGSHIKVEIPTDGENEGNEILWVDEADFVHGKMINSELPFWLARLADEKECRFTGEGVLVNSSSYDGMKSEDAKQKITEDLGGVIVTKSKLRDWVFARQRYWGEPTPIVYDEDGKMYPVHESNLPIILPKVDKFEPTDNGESPLAQVEEWVNVKGYIDEAGYFHEDASHEKVFRRETDTMPQWAGSSWYFMRYIDPKNDTSIGDPALLARWLPVDWYNGGMEHTTLHLLYSRFWYKFLHDIGIVPTGEPYYKRTSQGMILGAGGIKMSKSLGNVVNPDELIKSRGADVLRVYEMFIGPFDQSVAWDDKAIVGVERFLDKVVKIASKVTDDAQSIPVTHQSIVKVTDGIDGMLFNTSIAQLMICANEYEKQDTIARADFEAFLGLLAPFAPFITEELWKEMGNTVSIHTAAWPVADESKLVENEVTIAIQIGGKLRGTLVLPRDLAEMNVLDEVKKTEIYQKYVGEQTPKKIIFVPNKLINIVI
jgi:leucyl-tRNA synthetase